MTQCALHYIKWTLLISFDLIDDHINDISSHTPCISLVSPSRRKEFPWRDPPRGSWPGALGRFVLYRSCAIGSSLDLGPWTWQENSRPKAGQVYRNSMLQTSEFRIKWWLSLLKNDAVKVSWNNDIPRRWKNKNVPNQPAHVNRPLRLSLNTIRCCIVVSLKLNF